LVYFRFLISRNAAIPMMQATATAATMATSMVIKGASSVGSIASGSINVTTVGAEP
jgi:hypothetical protein